MSELPDRTEVLVVGAGPVGLAVAASLAGHGQDVTVVDRQATGANTSRAAVVHARTLEMLERIGVSKRLAGLGIHARQFSIRDGDRELLAVRFDGLPTEYPYTTKRRVDPARAQRVHADASRREIARHLVGRVLGGDERALSSDTCAYLPGR